jgi:hypothetical protein
MKLKNIAKSVIAASALTVASFGANAGAIATASLAVANFGLFNVSDNTPFAGADVDSSEFTGSTTSADGNERIYMDSDNDIDGLGYDNFQILSTSPLSVSYVGFQGANNGAGAAGVTYSSSIADGNVSATATSNLENTATFTVDDGDNAGSESLDLGFSFNYIYDLVAEVFGTGGTAEAKVNVTMSVKDSSGDSVALWVTPGQNIFNTNNINFSESTNDTLGNDSGEGQVVRFLSLMEGEEYTLFIDQNSEVDITSVPEPTSVAILGLGLLGLAGAARRRKA